jgi:hypothetical protein
MILLVSKITLWRRIMIQKSVLSTVLRAENLIKYHNSYTTNRTLLAGVKAFRWYTIFAAAEVEWSMILNYMRFMCRSKIEYNKESIIRV